MLRSSASQGALTRAVLGQQGLVTEAGYQEQAQSCQSMASAARAIAAGEETIADRHVGCRLQSAPLNKRHDNRCCSMALRWIDELRLRIPYIRRLHRRIDDLQHSLSAAEAVPLVYPATGSHAARIGEKFRTFLRHLQPHAVSGFHKRRLGAMCDGGYVMLDDFAGVTTALSLGVGPEVSWDADMAALGIRVLQFDNTVPRSPQADPLFVFHPLRVVGRPTAPGDVTLTDILARPELVSDRDVVAKIDIDGSEWELLAATAQTTLRRLRQIAIEFHFTHLFAEPGWGRNRAGGPGQSGGNPCLHSRARNNWGPFTVIGGIPRFRRPSKPPSFAGPTTHRRAFRPSSIAPAIARCRIFIWGGGIIQMTMIYTHVARMLKARGPLEWLVSASTGSRHRQKRKNDAMGQSTKSLRDSPLRG